MDILEGKKDIRSFYHFALFVPANVLSYECVFGGFFSSSLSAAMWMASTVSVLGINLKKALIFTLNDF